MKNPILVLFAVKDIIFEIGTTTLVVFCVELIIIYIFCVFQKMVHHKKKTKEIWFLIMFAAYIAMLLSATLIKRSYVENPLEKVWEGWSVVKVGHSRPYWNFDPLLNVFLLSPLTFFVSHLRRKKMSRLEFVIWALKLGLFVSLFIECSQVFFHRGTFQVADIVYNSLGALFGIILNRHCVPDPGKKV